MLVEVGASVCGRYAMAGGTRIPVMIGECGTRVVLRPIGCCTLGIAGSIRKRIGEYHPPDTTDLYFDLSGADAIDSTFIGLLLSLVSSKAGASVPAVHLLSPSQAVLEALERMRVLGMFEVCWSIPDPPTEWWELTGPTPEREEMTDLVIEAHQQLMDADPRNVEPFRRVVEGLQEQRPQPPPDEDKGE
ncbi:MAG TPA: STAS domain-containing protein [Phycisphaerae bacterium]|nr:STAS domain-containing protein [Phycisphaerae bacterium]